MVPPRALPVLGALVLTAAPAHADTLTVRIRTGAGAPVPGATAAALATSACAPAGDARCQGVVRVGPDGDGAIDGLVAGATYAVTASLPGHAVARRTGLAAGTAATVVLEPSSTTSAALPLFGGGTAGLFADGEAGVFYALTAGVPQLFRTTDWGGHWQPVTGTGDDARGLPASAPIAEAAAVATSGFPGEVAAALDGAVFFSRDYGVSWRPVAGAPAPSARLAWGHAGGTSVLVATAADHQLLADMTADAPELTAMAIDYARAADGRALGVGNGTDGPYVAVADSSGSVAVHALTASGTPGAAVMTASGFPATAPLAVALGGASGATGPPAGIAVASASQAGASVRATADATWGAATVTDAACATGGGGGFTADTGTTAGAGRGALGGCWLVLGGGALTASSAPTTSFAIDAGWGRTFGGTASHVVLRRGDRGPLKATALDGSGVPMFDPGAPAGAGTAPGGLAVDGLTAPVVTAATWGPGAPDEIAAVLAPASGAAAFASGDGGATMTLAAGTGGWAVDWFAAATGDWLVVGAPAASSHALTAVRDWTSTTTPAMAPNVDGAQTADDSLLLAGAGLEPAQTAVTALAGVPGSDLVFTGLGDGALRGPAAHGALRRLRLAQGPSGPVASEVVRVGDGQITAAVQALAYCPAAGSGPALADALLVATSAGLWRVGGAAGPAPGATRVPTVPAGAVVHDVAAACDTGRVWAATDGGLLGSSDGGRTFAVVPHERAGDVRAVGLAPGTPGEALIAVGEAGAIERTLDGGRTWVLVSDPVVRSFAAPGVADLLPAAGGGLGAFPAGDTLVAGPGLTAVALRTGAGPTGKPGRDRTPPVVKGFSVTRKSFTRTRGTAFAFLVDERVRARISLIHVTVGYRKGGRCVARRPRRPRRPVYCQREVASGAIVRRHLGPGRVRIRFAGRVSGRPLPLGAYRALLTAVDGSGNRSPRKTQHFHIVAG